MQVKLNGTEHKAELKKYVDQEETALILVNENNQAMVSLAIDFEEELPDYYVGLVDVDNFTWIEDFIKEYKLGKPTGIYCQSGDIKCQLYMFDLKRFNELFRIKFRLKYGFDEWSRLSLN